MKKQEALSTLKNMMELFAVVAPIICLIDCIAIPIVLAVLPFVGFHRICHGVTDQLLALLVFVLCAPTLIPGFIKHRKISVLACMSLGFGLIFFANFMGSAIDDTVHTLLTICGSVFLIRANRENRRLVACKSCCHSHVDSVASAHQQSRTR